MDHKQQHNERHRHQREERKKNRKERESQHRMGLPVHPFWLLLVGAVLTVGAVLVWIFAIP